MQLYNGNVIKRGIIQRCWSLMRLMLLYVCVASRKCELRFYPLQLLYENLKFFVVSENLSFVVHLWRTSLYAVRCTIDYSYRRMLVRVKIINLVKDDKRCRPSLLSFSCTLTCGSKGTSFPWNLLLALCSQNLMLLMSAVHRLTEKIKVLILRFMVGMTAKW